ncbi:MAG: MmgE/PrpD family protein [Chloroflexi bacterium]|nr:MmgE/PrpD family protein [Chloroflexota bacterium]
MYSRVLAEYVVGLRYEDLPQPVIAKAKECVLDFMGVALWVSHETPWGRMITELAAEGNCEGQSTIIGTPWRTIAPRAALANGTLGLGFEMEDSVLGTGVHVGPPTISAALAVAERQGASGRQLIEAIVAGYEVTSRVGAVTNQEFIHRGLHATANHATFGCAAASGKLLGLSADQLTNALGIAGMRSSGLMQGPDEGTMTRRLYGGYPSESGVNAALLAGKGFTGPEQVFEGKHGYFPVYAQGLDCRFERLNEGLGTKYWILNTKFKPYTSCGAFHTSVDAVLAIQRKYGVTPEQVERIEAEVFLASPAQAGKDVPSITGAQYRLPYTLAVAMVRGNASPTEYTEEMLRNPEVLAMVQRVDGTMSDEIVRLSEGFTRLPGKVTIRLKDGREFTEVVLVAKGYPENPFTPEELQGKFRRSAQVVISPEQCQNIIAAISRLEEMPDISELTRNLMSAPSVATP